MKENLLVLAVIVIAGVTISLISTQVYEMILAGRISWAAVGMSGAMLGVGVLIGREL